MWDGVGNGQEVRQIPVLYKKKTKNTKKEIMFSPNTTTSHDSQVRTAADLNTFTLLSDTNRSVDETGHRLVFIYPL